MKGVLHDRYRLDRLVGQGGFGSVYAAVHLALDTAVAIKVLDIHRFVEPDARAELVERFLDEGRVLTKLRHPNIVAALDLGVMESGEPYLVLEWVEGRTLKDMLAARGPLPLDIAWALFEPVLDALAFAHEARVVHRDLKPANVMVVEAAGGGMSPRVIDFGIAKIVAPDDTPGSGITETLRGAYAHTPAYAAPEQVTRSRTGPWTDVHALGLLFVEMVTGSAPYRDAENMGLAAVDPERPTPAALGVDVGSFEDVIARAIALRPRDRFADARAMLDAAREAARDMPAPTAASATPRTKRSLPPQAPREARSIARPPPLRPSQAPLSGTSAITLLTGQAPAHTPSPWRMRAIVAAATFALAAGIGVVIGRQKEDRSAVTHSSVLRAGGLMWHPQNGAWREDEGALTGSGGQVYSDWVMEDGEIALDIEVISDNAKAHSVGVGFRAKPAIDPSDGSGYGANLRISKGTFNVFKGTDGEWRPIDPAYPSYHPSPAITPRKVSVVIRAKGAWMEVEVNGTVIASFHDETYKRGRVTLWVESMAQTVRFSKIRAVSRGGR